MNFPHCIYTFQAAEITESCMYICCVLHDLTFPTYTITITATKTTTPWTHFSVVSVGAFAAQQLNPTARQTTHLRNEMHRIIE